MKHSRLLNVLLAAVLILCWSDRLRAYGPVGHLRVVMVNWNSLIAPRLNRESQSDKDLLFAALAGSVASDIGYAIPRARSFSDRVHYVRSGDFVQALIAEAQRDPYRKDARFLAFALGFLTHYSADRCGHYYGTNELVALINKAKIARMTYERDPATHTWVETRLGVIDIADVPSILNSGFVESIAGMHGEENHFLQMAFNMLKAASEEVYPGSTLGFNAFDLYRYLRFVVGLLSLTDGVTAEVYPDVPLSRCPICQELLKKAQSDPDVGPSLSQLEADLKNPLPLDPKKVEAIYHQSLGEVEKNLDESAKRVFSEQTLENFNLDTNLSSKGGQYRCADSAFQKLNNARKSVRATSPEQINALKKFDAPFSIYQREGRKVQESFTQSPKTDELSGLLSSSDLRGIVPDVSGARGITLQPVANCPLRIGEVFGLGNSTFLYDPSARVLCFPSIARSVEALYAYLTVQEWLSTSPGVQTDFERLQNSVDKVLPMYLEAIERLRLGPEENKDSRTDLYPIGVCAPTKQRTGAPAVP